MSPTVAQDVAEKIRVGVAGWSYPDWNGIVYPQGTRDLLGYLSRYVDVIEINSTFYRPPERPLVQRWLQRTERRPDLVFCAKLHRDVTHHGRVEPAMVRSFHTALAPLKDAGRLAHLLAQFRWDFADTEDTRGHLRNMRNRFGDLANLALELRHASWQRNDALEFLAALGVTVANLDYPTASNSFNMRLCPVGRDAYLRLHGRNRAAWFDKKAGRDRTYDYCYSDAEIDDIVERAAALGEMSRSLTLIANNHFAGKEVLNALEIKSRLTGEKVDVPPGLAKRYPRANRIAKTPPAPRQPELPLG